jgi:hypothetical protein
LKQNKLPAERKIDMSKVESMAMALQNLIEDVEIAEGVLALRLAPLLKARASLAIWKRSKEVKKK